MPSPNSQNPPPGDAAMQLSSEDLADLTDMLKQCGLLAVAACEDASEAQAKKARTGPYDNPRKTRREIAKLANPALVARSANSVHILEEAVKSGGDGSLDETVPGDPVALRGLPPPAATKPRSPCATCASRESARRTDAPKRHSQRHRDSKSKPGGRTNEMNVPREPKPTSQHSQSFQSTLARPVLSRTPRFLTAWFFLLVSLPSPGSKIRADAATSSHAQSGSSLRDDTFRFAPGDVRLDHQQPSASQLQCSEHNTASSQACYENPCPTEDSRRTLDEGPQARASHCEMIPGIQLSCQATHSEHMKIPGIASDSRDACPARSMSDMSHARQKEDSKHTLGGGPPAHVPHCQMIPGIQLSCQATHSEHLKIPGFLLDSRDACSGRSMSDMLYARDSEVYVCSHVGYIPEPSRLETCPGQRARQFRSRLETCPGQSARQPRSRQLACSEQCAWKLSRNCSSRSCPGQTAQQHRHRATCPGQHAQPMVQSRAVFTKKRRQKDVMVTLAPFFPRNDGKKTEWSPWPFFSPKRRPKDVMVTLAPFFPQKGGKKT